MTDNYIKANITATIVNSLPADVRNHIYDETNPHNITCEKINAFPNQEGVVIDNNYNHTDNNYTTEEKSAVNNLIANKEALDNLGNFNNTLQELSTEVDNNYQDLQNNYIKKTDFATSSEAGIVKTRSNGGIFTNNGYLYISPPTDSEITNKNAEYKAITTTKIDIATKTALTTNSLIWTEEEKLAARNLLGAISSTDIKPTSPNPNLLYNPDFKINQREKTYYEPFIARLNIVDRWMKDAKSIINIVDGVLTFANSSTTDPSGIVQFVPDHSNLLGKKATFSVKLIDNETIYSLTVDIPPKNQTITQNSVIGTLSTDFGAISIEYGKANFFVRIMANCPESEENITYLTPEWAKLEIGDTFTGYEPVNPHDELEKCYRFYQKTPNEAIFQPAYIYYESGLTKFVINCTLARPMYAKPSVKYSETSLSYFSEGSPCQDFISDDYYVGNYTPDNRIFLLEFGKQEDNTAILNGQTELYKMCWAKLTQFEFEAEIKK